jgi:hypothetical protein
MGVPTPLTDDQHCLTGSRPIRGMKLNKPAGRRKPYTQRGIERLTCCIQGCTNKAKFTWSICADKNLLRPLCAEHDVALNEMAMRFAFGNTREDDLARYRRKVLG